MQLHRLKLRFRRVFRLRKRQVEGISLQAERQLELNFIRRLGRLVAVRRFVGIWLLIIIVFGGTVIVQTRALSGYYQTLQPVPGGMYSEGIVGEYTNANPLYATGQADEAVSHLIFPGLFKYNDQNQLVGDLADSWSVNATGEVYTIHLRPGLTWQDGQPLTANDVVFTYQSIQNPDTQSPLYDSWQSVTVTASDAQTVVFTLPNPLSSFPYSLTTGIIPQHILGSVPADQLRSASFNTTQPVGSGPFAMQAIQVTGDTPQTREEEVELKPFAHYYGGKPKLDNFVVNTFGTQEAMVQSFKEDQLNAMVGLTSLPTSLKNVSDVTQYSMPLSAENMVFFKTSQGVLSDTKVRQALVAGSNTSQIINQLGYKTTPVNEPLLTGQLGYNPAYTQSSYNPAQAAQLLTKDGWLVGSGGFRYKDGQQLTFGLYAQDDSEDAMVAHALQKQWRQIGVNVPVYLEGTTNMQQTIATHSYDALLYGISIGPDPDVFVYWDSSQNDLRSARLNFSEYSSTTADASLEAGRTRSDPQLRAIKYEPFLRAWQRDAPALGLYQPRFLYVTRGKVFGLTEHTLNVDTDRYDNVQNWMIRQTPENIVK